MLCFYLISATLCACLYVLFCLSPFPECSKAPLGEGRVFYFRLLLFYAIGGLFVIWLLVKVSIVIREIGTYFFDYFGIVIYHVTTN